MRALLPNRPSIIRRVRNKRRTPAVIFAAATASARRQFRFISGQAEARRAIPSKKSLPGAFLRRPGIDADYFERLMASVHPVYYYVSLSRRF
ncbi:hypothetical protein GWI33_016845 [Rhynchophorus ferrugineus]|uniref:Uncharacterized protein n=1 Tax=Rhynchophorus ferrugineus TaxID=354439 RepID=A0A834HX72_RHYFE|nr:hypothetical protein GWI33_016845 [Rhynchophorus ferrugineus]